MAVKLKERSNKNGTTSLYLDIYHNGKRSYEFLTHLKLKPGKDSTDHNKKTRQLAKAIETKRAHELTAGIYDIATQAGRNAIMVEWMQDFIDKYDKNDVRNLQGALNRFIQYLSKYKINGQLTFGQLESAHIKKYIDFLKANSRGEGAASYYARFKKMLKVAMEKNLLTKNPFSGISPRFDEAESKDVLSLDEIRLLKETSCNSDVVRRAAIFSCMTGFAWIDVKNLTWEMIKTSNWTVRKPRQKTNSKVYINLNVTAIEMIGEPGNKSDLVFDLPTANGCNKTLKAWVERAGIDKKIRWHNLRHSFGTNLAHNEIPIVEIKDLMGHKTLKYTERYVKASAEIKQRATDGLTI